MARKQERPAGKPDQDEPHPRLALLRKVIEERAFSLASVAGAMSPPRHRSWLSKALRGERRLHEDDVDQILDIIGMSRVQFSQRFLSAISGKKSPKFSDLDPAILLLSFVDDREIEEPEPIAQLLRMGLPPMQHDPLEDLPPQLRELDKVRLSNPENANAQCLEWIAALRAKMAAQGYRPALLAEILTALGAFASISRTLGNNRTAVRVLASALEQTRSVSGLVLASLLWRSSPILTDHGYPMVAAAALERAVGIFHTHACRVEVAGAHLSLGTQNFVLGFYENAIRCFERCLTEPLADDHYRTMALANIANIYEHQQKPGEAIALLESLEALLSTASPGVVANARWIRARALASSDELERAAELFASLELEIQRYAAPSDSLLLFCDYAAVLTRLGDSRRLRVATEMLQERMAGIELPAAMYKLASQMLEASLRKSMRIDEWRRWRGRLADLARRP